MMTPPQYSFSVTNNLPDALVNSHRLCSLDEGGGWSGVAAFLFCENEDVPADVVTTPDGREYLLFTVEYLGPGGTKVYDLLRGSP